MTSQRLLYESRSVTNVDCLALHCTVNCSFIDDMCHLIAVKWHDISMASV